MLRLILSTDWIAGREAVLERVAEDVRNLLAAVADKIMEINGVLLEPEVKIW